MTSDKLIQLLTGQFYNNFAEQVATDVCRSSATVALLYDLPITAQELDPRSRAKLLFRRAYVLERIYFNHPDQFAPLRERFVDDFPLCNNESAKRHFGKIMSHLLASYQPTDDQAEAIAQSVAAWIIAPHTRVAVKIHAIEVLMLLKNRVSWIEEVWRDLLVEVTKTETPAITVRKRGWQ